MQMQSDNTSIGFVRVPSAEEARHAIAQFHRKKIGYKRIHVALHDGVSSTTSSIKSVHDPCDTLTLRLYSVNTVKKIDAPVLLGPKVIRFRDFGFM